MTKLEGSRALVTGANRGLGRCIAEELLIAGIEQLYLAAPQAESLAELVANDSDRVVPIALDITNETQVRQAAKRASDVDFVFNNAGTGYFSTPLAADLDLAERDFRVNVLGTLRVIQAFTPVLEGKGGGTFVNVLSLLALAPITWMSPYCASKAASYSLSLSLRAELSSKGISLIDVYPGAMDTDLMKGVDAQKADPREVAKAILESLESGVEDITPDGFSSSGYVTWRRDPKELERELAAF